MVFKDVLMKVNATDMKNFFGRYLKKCAEEDIYISKNGRIIAKLSSYEDTRDGYMTIKEGIAAYSHSSRRVSYKEFLEITEGNEQRYEYIDGEVYLLASPGFTHQSIHSNLYEKLILWFSGKTCRVLSAPFDVTLNSEETNSKNVLQPDLLVACDHHETTNSNDRYMGIPSLVIEILSPESRSKDMVKKLNVYMEGGVNEYWVIDPKNRQVLLYSFINKKLDQMVAYKQSEVFNSVCFKGLAITVTDIFNNV